MTKLFIANFPYRLSMMEIQQLFALFGRVSFVKLIFDHKSHESKGFGFVEMQNKEEAGKAVKMLHDQLVDGRKVIVSEATGIPMKKNKSRLYTKRFTGIY